MTSDTEVKQTELTELERLEIAANKALAANAAANKARADLKAAQRKEWQALDTRHGEALSAATRVVTQSARLRDKAAGQYMAARLADEAKADATE